MVTYILGGLAVLFFGVSVVLFLRGRHRKAEEGASERGRETASKLETYAKATSAVIGLVSTIGVGVVQLFPGLAGTPPVEATLTPPVVETLAPFGLGDIAYDAEKQVVTGVLHTGAAADREQYRVLVFIQVDGSETWYVKPTYDARSPATCLVAIGEKGFSVPLYRKYPEDFTDEVTRVAVLLMPADYGGPGRASDYAGALAASVENVIIDV